MTALPSTQDTRRVSHIIAGLLLVLFFLQSFSASRLKSPTHDEPVHIGAGLSYVAKHVFVANPQHPPLLKELAGISLLAAGTRYPDSWSSRQLLAGGSRFLLEQPVGDSIIAQNPDRVLLWARLPLVLVGTGLGLVIFLWGREIAGDWAAIGALLLYSLDPTIIAHSGLVTTDVGFAAFAMLFLYALYKFHQRRTLVRLSLCGLSVGAALCTKFSAIFLLPIAAILLREALKYPGPASSAPPHPWLDTRSETRLTRRSFAILAGSFLAMCLIAMLVVDLCYLSWRGPWLYAYGFTAVNVDHDPNFLAFMAGHLQHGFLSYFAVAYLLKEPLVSIALAGAGAAIILRSKTFATLTKLYLFVPPIIFFASYLAGADDIGIRYIIPVLPFAYLAGGIALAALATGAKWQRFAAACACAWLVIAAIGIYPDHLSYFNESACLLRGPSQIGFDGGTRCGPDWLADSNVDWGQGVKQLDAWLKHNASGAEPRLFYFGTFPPQFYGVHAEDLTIPKMIGDPPPGLYVISAHIVAALPAVGERDGSGAGAWLRTTTPDAIVGHSLYIYEIPTTSTLAPGNSQPSVATSSSRAVH